jgi:hypothetical protein
VGRDDRSDATGELIRIGTRGRGLSLAVSSAADRGNRYMNVRDLTCWPPKWRGASNGSSHVVNDERGILTAVRWDLKTRSLTLTREDEGHRHSAVLEDEVRVLTKLYLLLGWHIGRPLAKIASLEMTPSRQAR